MSSKGLFIVIEGLDGAGKSTQVSKITEEFKKKGKDVVFLHFPRYESPVYGELISSFLRGDMGSNDSVDPRLVALIYAGDRADAASQIKGWLDQGLVVIADRYVYSNIAYQCAKSDTPEELRKWIFSLEYEHNKIPVPDLSMFLDVPFSFTAAKLTANRDNDSDRAYLNGKADIHEASLSFQEKVRREYIIATELDPRFVRVDCSDINGAMASADVIYSRINEVLESL